MNRISPAFLCVLVLSISACDGSGSSNSAPITSSNADPDISNPDATKDTTPTPSIVEVEQSELRRPMTGRVYGAVSGVPLMDVSITLAAVADGLPLLQTLTDEQGRYTLSNLRRDTAYELLIERDGYKSERLGIAASARIGESYLELVRLVSDDNAGTGNASGSITSLLDGEPVSGLTVAFVPGAGNRDVDATVVTSTAIDGTWSVTGLQYGNWICIVYGPGFPATTTTITVLGGIEQTDLDSVVIPELADNQIAVVASRAPAPAPINTQLKALMLLPDDASATVYPSREGSTRITQRPHVTVIDLPAEGVMNYWLTGSPVAWTPYAEIGARVRVFGPEGLRAEFTPAGDSSLRNQSWWIMDIDLQTGNITPKDYIS